MDWQDPDEPEWRRKAVDLEYWVLTIFVAGAIVLGVVSAVVGVLTPWFS